MYDISLKKGSFPNLLYMKKNILRPGLLILLALSPLALRHLQPLLPSYTETTAGYHLFFALPYVLILGSAFLGIRLNQTRIFFSMVLFAVLYFTLGHLDSTYFSELNRSSLLGLIGFFTPACLILFFVIPEGALIGAHGILRFSLLMLFSVTCMQLAGAASTTIHDVLSARFILTLESWHLPDIIWLPTLGAFVYFIMPHANDISQFKVAVISSIISLIICLNRTADNELITADLRIFQAVCFTVIGSIVLYAIYKLYWHKVYIDELTSVPNRRAFNEKMNRLGRRFVIAMVDIDYFKKFNDTYGHAEGDNVLRYVAGHLDDKSGAEVYRYGGEEFALVYTGMHMKDIFWRLELTRETLEERDFYIRMQETLRLLKSAKDRGRRRNGMKKVHVTISIGASQRNDKYRTPEDVLTAADKALYSAKQKGRNCIVKKW